MRPRLMSEIVQSRHIQLVPHNPSNFISEDSSIFSVNTNFYAAIFEFSQGSFPKTIWEYGIMSAANPDNFKLLIVNTPINAISTAFNTHSSTVVSSFDGVYYIAVYFQLFDIEARGFTRQVIFTIANQCQEVVQNIYTHYSKEIDEFVKKLQKPSHESFPNDLIKFAKSLKLLQEKEQTNLIINSKMKELTTILNHFGITDISSEGAEEKSFEFFSMINNDLRSVRDLTNFKEVVDDLEHFINNLPPAKFIANIQNLTQYYETNYSMDFGNTSGYTNINAFPEFTTDLIIEESQILEKDSETISKVSIRRLLKSRIFYFVAFTLLSGQTLIIKSRDKKLGSFLAKKLSILCPFFREKDLHICTEIDAISSLKYSIVVCNKVIGEYKNIVSFLDIDVGFYSGDGCPQTSYVWRVLGRCTDLSENAFILNVLLRLKSTSSEFIIKLSSIAEGKESSPDHLINSMKEIGFSVADIPIMKYWIHAYFNKNSLIKPILANNKSSTGLILAPY